MSSWYYCKCGHEEGEHFEGELESGCRCGSCVEYTAVQCRHGKDPEDNEGPRCACTVFELDHRSNTPPWEK